MIWKEKRSLVIAGFVAATALAGCSGGAEQQAGDEEPLETLPEREPEGVVTTGDDGGAEAPTARGVQQEEEEVVVRPDGTIAAPADVASVPDDAMLTPSGLASRVLREGTGTRRPGPTSKVRVHYTGWTTDGKMFDSSVARGEPISFPLDKVIQGWQQGVMMMVEGEKRRLWIPESLAYKGKEGFPKGMLVFDVELLEIED